jgi:hypothetical protein
MTKQAFVFGKPVGDDSFTDREIESARLTANFKNSINTFIVSPRRWGKTSLVKKVIRELDEDKTTCVFADVFKAKTPLDFCEILGNAVLRQTSSAFEEFVDNAKKFLGRLNIGVNLSNDSVNPISLQFGLTGEQQSIDDVLVLAEKIARKKQIHIVVCLDEFQQIAEFEDSLSFQKQLRTAWQHQENVTYCLFGSKKHLMENLFDDESKPFYKFGDIIYLKRISLSYWNSFISERFMQADKTITGAQIERICRTVDFHSSYVQQLCWYVYLFSDSIVTDEDVDKGIEELIDQNTALFESRTDNLTPVQMRFLKAVADGVKEGFSSSHVISKYKLGSSASSVATRKTLIEKSLLYSDNGLISLSDPVMGLWLGRP